MGGCVALEPRSRARAACARSCWCASGAALHAAPRIPAVSPRRPRARSGAPFYRDAYSPKASPDVMRRGFIEDLKTDPRVAARRPRSPARLEPQAELAASAAPTLVVVGEDEDPAMRERRRSWLAARIRGATLCRVPDARPHAARSSSPRRSPAPCCEFLRTLAVSLSGRVAIAGAYEHPTRWAPDKTEFQIMAESARGALADCGLALARRRRPASRRHVDGRDGRRAARRVPEPEAALARRHEHRRLVVRRAREPRGGGDPRRASARWR